MDKNNSVRLDDEYMEKISGGLFEPSEHMIMVNKGNYRLVAASAPTVLIMFGASWASPCVTLKGVLETVASENGAAVIGLVDTDKEEKLCKLMKVTSIPTTIRFKNGVEVERIIGYQPFDTWKNMF